MLLCFGETKKVARRNYLRAIRIGIDPDAPEIESSWHPFDRIKDDPLETDANAIHVDVLGRSTDLERPTLEADEFVRRVCELADFDFEYLRRGHGIATRPKNDESSPLSVWKDGVRKERGSLRY